MLQDSFGSAERSSEKPINIVFCKAYTVILQRGGLIEFTVTPNYLYTVSRLCGNSYDFASVASISVNLKCYKTAEGYEDTLRSFILNEQSAKQCMDNADKGEFSVARNETPAKPAAWIRECTYRVCTLMWTEWIIETRDVQWTGCHACMYSRTDACKVRFDVCCFIMLLTSWLIGILFALCSFQCSQMAMIADDETEYFVCSAE